MGVVRGSWAERTWPHHSPTMELNDAQAAPKLIIGKRAIIPLPGATIDARTGPICTLMYFGPGARERETSGGSDERGEAPASRVDLAAQESLDDRFEQTAAVVKRHREVGHAIARLDRGPQDPRRVRLAVGLVTFEGDRVRLVGDGAHHAQLLRSRQRPDLAP